MNQLKLTKTSRRRPNALKHGAFSSVTIFPWEDKAEYEALLRELVDEWQPSGAFEEEAVCTIARCMWKKRRILEKRQLEVFAELNKPPASSSRQAEPFFKTRSERTNWWLAQRKPARATIPPGANRDVENLLEFSTSLYGDLSERTLGWKFTMAPEFAAELNIAVPREKYMEWIDYMRALKQHVDEVMLPRAIAAQPKDGLAAKIAAEFLTETRVMEDLAMEERLDIVMDKAIRRLAQAKTLKQVSGIRMIKSV
jgi:hypothetical protein